MTNTWITEYIGLLRNMLHITLVNEDHCQYTATYLLTYWNLPQPVTFTDALMTTDGIILVSYPHNQYNVEGSCGIIEKLWHYSLHTWKKKKHIQVVDLSLTNDCMQTYFYYTYIFFSLLLITWYLRKLVYINNFAFRRRDLL